MIKNEKGNINILYIIIVIVMLVLLGLGLFFMLNNDNSNTTTNTELSLKNIKNELVTSENYNEIHTKVAEELGDVDETYHFTYACMYYIMHDGLTEEYLQTQNEDLLYKSIYNKTVQDLINEGKKLMQDNNITVEEFKKTMEELSNDFNN